MTFQIETIKRFLEFWMKKVMKRNNYLKLSVYVESLQLAREITKSIYKLKPYRLIDQVIASSVSIPSNIAEGSQMNSAVHFKKYLYIASGSAAELETQLKVIQEIDELDFNKAEDWLQKVGAIQAMIRGLIKRFDEDDNQK